MGFIEKVTIRMCGGKRTGVYSQDHRPKRGSHRQKGAEGGDGPTFHQGSFSVKGGMGTCGEE